MRRLLRRPNSIGSWRPGRAAASPQRTPGPPSMLPCSARCPLTRWRHGSAARPTPSASGGACWVSRAPATGGSANTAGANYDGCGMDAVKLEMEKAARRSPSSLPRSGASTAGPGRRKALGPTRRIRPAPPAGPRPAGSFQTAAPLGREQACPPVERGFAGSALVRRIRVATQEGADSPSCPPEANCAARAGQHRRAGRDSASRERRGRPAFTTLAGCAGVRPTPGACSPRAAGTTRPR